MSDQSKEELEAIQVEAQQLLDEIKQFRKQSEEQFKAAEVSRKNANSEGLFAINAKRTCEEHATAISQLKGAVETDVKSIETNRQKVDELTALITASKPVIEADTKRIAECRSGIEQASSGITDAAEKGVTRLKEIEASKTSIDELSREAGFAIRVALH